MRLQKTDIVAGVPASVARDVIRKYQANPRAAGAAADILTATAHTDLHGILAQLQAEGYLDVDSVDENGDTWGRQAPKATHWPWQASANPSHESR